MTVEGTRSGLWRSPLVWVVGAALLGIGIFLIQQPHSEIWVRVGLALMLFVLPGGLLFSFVPLRSPLSLVDFAGYGFAVSLVLISVLGLLARTLHWTFDAIQLIWFGLTALSACAFLFAPKKRMRVHLKKPSTSTVALIAIALVHIGLFAYSGIPYAYSTDEPTYQVEILHFLSGEPFSWQEIYYETGNLFWDRYYLSYWTLAQALVVAVSGVHILQAHFVIHSMLMLFAVFAVHIFTRNLGHSSKTAWIIVVLQLFCLSLLLEFYWQPAGHFHMHLIQDKGLASFIVAPIAISTAYLYFATRRRAAYISFVLLFLALTFAHVMITGFVLVLIGLWCCLRMASDRKNGTSTIAVGLMALVLFFPAIFLRLNTDETLHNYGNALLETDRNILVYEDTSNPLDGGNPFYIANPDAAGGLTYVLLVLVLFAVALRRWDGKSRLMLALALTAVFVLLPVTAWIYGRLVSALHMFRVLWLIPYGYMLFFVLATFCDRLCKRLPLNPSPLTQDRVLIPLLSLTILSTVLFLSTHREVDFSRDISPVLAGDQDLLALADYIEAHHDERVWFLASPRWHERILSTTPKVITLSHYHLTKMAALSSLPLEQTAMQLDDHAHFLDEGASFDERIGIIEKYGIDYLLFAEAHDGILQQLLENDPARFEVVLVGSQVKLIEVKDCCVDDV